MSIGIFDSGLGGLTVARAVMAAMPYEKIIYFGDTACLVNMLLGWATSLL